MRSPYSDENHGLKVECFTILRYLRYEFVNLLGEKVQLRNVLLRNGWF